MVPEQRKPDKSAQFFNLVREDRVIGDEHYVVNYFAKLPNIVEDGFSNASIARERGEDRRSAMTGSCGWKFTPDFNRIRRKWLIKIIQRGNGTVLAQAMLRVMDGRNGFAYLDI